MWLLFSKKGVCVCVCVCVFIGVCVYACEPACVCVCVCVCVCLWACMCVCAWACMCVCVRWVSVKINLWHFGSRPAETSRITRLVNWEHVSVIKSQEWLMFPARYGADHFFLPLSSLTFSLISLRGLELNDALETTPLRFPSCCRSLVFSGAFPFHCFHFRQHGIKREVLAATLQVYNKPNLPWIPQVHYTVPQINLVWTFHWEICSPFWGCYPSLIQNNNVVIKHTF